MTWKCSMTISLHCFAIVRDRCTTNLVFAPYELPSWQSQVVRLPFQSFIPRSVWPSPVGELLWIQTSLVAEVGSTGAAVKQLLPRASSLVAENTLEVVDGQDCQRKAVSFIPNGELERRVDVALLLVAYIACQ